MSKPPPSFPDILRSEQFTFLIGKDKQAVIVHGAAIAALSAPLNNLINGPMAEAQNKCAEFPDLNVDDFYRLCEYAYRGDFATPACEIDEGAEEGEDQLAVIDRTWLSEMADKKEDDDAVTASSTPYMGFTPPRTGRKKPGKNPDQYNPPESSKQALRTKFDTRTYTTPLLPSPQIQQSFAVVPNTSPTQNYTPIFLSYARLYIFASIHLISPLRILTLHKLHKTLLNFKLYHNRVPDVIAWARYVYESEDLGEGDELREMVVEYIVREMDVVGRSGEFLGMLGDGGRFVEDFWKVVMEFLL